MMSPVYAEMAISTAFGFLSFIFLSAFVILIIIRKRQKHNIKDHIVDAQTEISKVNRFVIEPEKDLELIPVFSHSEAISTNEKWMDEATALIPHCLSLLKTCRSLSFRLTTLAMSSIPKSGNFSQFVDSSKKISERVEEVVKCMCPPSNPKLLEARAIALTLAMTQFALIAKNECEQANQNLVWIDTALAEMDKYMFFLRAASQDCMNRSIV